MPTYFVDLDGTILDPKAGMVGSLREALREIGHPGFADDDLDWIIGPPIIDSLEKLLGVGERTGQALLAYRHHYVVRQRMFEFTVYDGMVDAIAALRTTGRFYICTMKPTVFAQQILTTLGLHVPVYGADLNGQIRHKRQIIWEAMKDLAVDPTTCLMIGDRGSDIKAARDSAMWGLGVTWGYGSQQELLAAGAVELCHAPTALAHMAYELADGRRCA